MKIGLFIPCYVDALYPEVGVATYKLLTSLGLDVTYPLKQTCCGQPMANAGFEKMATDISRHFDGHSRMPHVIDDNGRGGVSARRRDTNKPQGSLPAHSQRT